MDIVNSEYINNFIHTFERKNIGGDNFKYFCCSSNCKQGSTEIINGSCSNEQFQTIQNGKADYSVSELRMSGRHASLNTLQWVRQNLIGRIELKESIICHVNKLNRLKIIVKELSKSWMVSRYDIEQSDCMVQLKHIKKLDLRSQQFPSAVPHSIAFEKIVLM